MTLDRFNRVMGTSRFDRIMEAEPSRFDRVMREPTRKGLMGKWDETAVLEDILKTRNKTAVDRVKKITEKVVDFAAKPMGEVLSAGKSLSLEAPYKPTETIARLEEARKLETPAFKEKYGRAATGGLAAGVLPETLTPPSIKLKDNADEIERALFETGGLVGSAAPIGAEYALLNKVGWLSKIIKYEDLSASVAKKLGGYLLRTAGRTLRAGTAGVGYSLYEDETKPEDIAKNAAWFILFDTGFGTAGDILKGIGRMKSQLDSLGVGAELFDKNMEGALREVDGLKFGRSSPKAKAYAEIKAGGGDSKFAKEVIDSEPFSDKEMAKRLAENRLKEEDFTAPTLDEVESGELGPGREQTIEDFMAGKVDESGRPINKRAEKRAEDYFSDIEDDVKKYQGDGLSAFDSTVKALGERETRRQVFLIKSGGFGQWHKSGKSGKSSFETDYAHEYLKNEPEYSSRFGPKEKIDIRNLFKQTWGKIYEVNVKLWAYKGPLRLAAKQGVVLPEQVNKYISNLKEFETALDDLPIENDFIIDGLTRRIGEHPDWNPVDKRRANLFLGKYIKNAIYAFRKSRNPDYLLPKDFSPENLDYVNHSTTNLAKVTKDTWKEINSFMKNYGRDLVDEGFLSQGQYENNQTYFTIYVLDHMAKDLYHGRGKVRSFDIPWTKESRIGSEHLASVDVVEIMRHYLMPFEKWKVFKKYVLSMADNVFPESYEIAKEVAAGKPTRTGYNRFFFDAKKFMWAANKSIGTIVDDMSSTLKRGMPREVSEAIDAGIDTLHPKPKEGIFYFPDEVVRDLNEFYRIPSHLREVMKYVQIPTNYWKYVTVRVFGLWQITKLSRDWLTNSVYLIRGGGLRYLPTSLSLNVKHFWKIATGKLEENILKSARFETEKQGIVDTEKPSLDGNDISFLWKMSLKRGLTSGRYHETFGFSKTPGELLLWNEPSDVKRLLKKTRSWWYEKKQDPFIMGVEGSFRFAQLCHYYEAEKKVAIKAGNLDGFKSFGFSNAWVKMNNSQIGYRDIPDWQGNFLSRGLYPFWTFTQGNVKSWYHAIKDGSPREKIASLAILATLTGGPAIWNYMVSKEATKAIMSDPKYSYTWQNFFMLLVDPNDTSKPWRDSTGRFIMLSTQVGVDDITFQLGLKGALHEMMFSKEKPMSQRMIDAALHTPLGLWRGDFWRYHVQNLNPLATTTMFEYPSTGGEDMLGNFPLYDSTDTELEKTLKSVANFGLLMSRNIRWWLDIANGEQWMAEWIANMTSPETQRKVYEYLDVRSTSGPGKAKLGDAEIPMKLIRYLPLQIKALKVDIPNPKPITVIKPISIRKTGP